MDKVENTFWESVAFKISRICLDNKYLQNWMVFLGFPFWICQTELCDWHYEKYLETFESYSYKPLHKIVTIDLCKILKKMNANE